MYYLRRCVIYGKESVGEKGSESACNVKGEKNVVMAGAKLSQRLVDPLLPVSRSRHICATAKPYHTS